MASPSSTPIVSALVTAYNAARFVGRALDSLLTQTLADLEVIAVDDGSFDRTAEIIDGYARRDTRVRAFHQPNRGHPVALNRALAEARGEFIAVLDADDLALPDRFERQVAYLQAQPNVGVVGGEVIVVDENERKLMHWRYPTRPADLRQALYRGPAINHSSSMTRHELFRRLGGYRMAFDVTVDVDLFLRASDFTDLATLPQAVVYYRTHGGQTTAHYNPRQRALNLLALALSRSRRRGEVDDMPPGFIVTAGTIDRLALTEEDVAQIRPLLVDAALPPYAAAALASIEPPAPDD
jgi:glycosyltransferase involved in cell wall biosynthesis